LVGKGAKDSGIETVDAPSEGQRSQMVDGMRQCNTPNSSISAESEETKLDTTPRQSLSTETGEGAYLDDSESTDFQNTLFPNFSNCRL
jgi:hypothetical protein